MTIVRLIGCSFALLALLSPLAVSALEPASPVTLEMSSKRYSSGYLPLTGSYVEYEVSLTNEGDLATENQTLLVSLVSDDNRTHSSAAYSVPLLNPGDSRTMHLGPFRMEGEGDHHLIADIDGAAGYTFDSFTVYRQEAVNAALVAIPLIAAGAGIIGFSLYRRRKAV